MRPNGEIRAPARADKRVNLAMEGLSVAALSVAVYAIGTLVVARFALGLVTDAQQRARKKRLARLLASDLSKRAARVEQKVEALPL